MNGRSPETRATPLLLRSVSRLPGGNRVARRGKIAGLSVQETRKGQEDCEFAGSNGLFLIALRGTTSPYRSGNELSSSNPMHQLTAAIDEWVDAKVLSEGVPPAQPQRTRLLLLAEDCKHSTPGNPFCSGCRESKVAYCVTVTGRHMLSQSSEEGPR